MYYATNLEDSLIGMMGDSVKIKHVKALKAISPLPGQFRLIHDGKILNTTSGKNYQYTWSEPIKPGAYRIEIQIKLRGKDIPWLYSNPIYVY